MRSPRWPVPAAQHVVDHRQPGQRLGELEGPDHPAGRPVGGDAVQGPPSKVHRPLSGLSKPVSRLKNVVLPAPLGPISAVIAPLDLEVVDVHRQQPPKAAGRRWRPGSGRAWPRRGRGRRRRMGGVWRGGQAWDQRRTRPPPSVAEDALWSVDHQQHQREPEHVADDADPGAAEDPVDVRRRSPGGASVGELRGTSRDIAPTIGPRPGRRRRGSGPCRR